MAYENPRDRKENRVRVNLNDDLFEAVRALARVNKMQTATYARKVIEDHVKTRSLPVAEHPDILRCRVCP